MDDQNKKSNVVGFSVIGVILVILAGLGILFFNKKTPVDLSTLPTPVGTTTDVVATTPGKKTVYKSGTYTAEGSYNSPAGLDTIDVTVTLVNDVITDATVVAKAEHPESRQYQNKFISGFKQYVVGKNIDEVSLSRVSGASLTPKGFTDALSKIKLEAKA